MKTKLSTELILDSPKYIFKYKILVGRIMRINHLIIIIFLGLLSCVDSQTNEISVYDLKSEYLVNPIGLDVETPRLTWKIKDQRRGAIQKAYKISVGTDSAKVALGKGSHWNTGKVNAEHQMVLYAGKALQAFQKYYWSLTVWDKNDKKVQSDRPASFEMGMMETRNWRARGSPTAEISTKKKAPTLGKNLKSKRK